jgi:hypothetical protein
VILRLGFLLECPLSRLCTKVFPDLDSGADYAMLQVNYVELESVLRFANLLTISSTRSTRYLVC